VVLPAEVVRVEVLGERPEEIAQRRSLRVHVHEHPSIPRLARKVGEADALGRIALREVVGVGRPGDAPVEAVRPQVVRALQLRGVPGARLAETSSPVLARVEEGAHAIGTGSHDDDRVRAELEREVVADVGDVGQRAHEVPHARPQPVPLECLELGRQITLFGDQSAAEVGLGKLPGRCPAGRVDGHGRES
jgi:hypothetical protein